MIMIIAQFAFFIFGIIAAFFTGYLVGYEKGYDCRARGGDTVPLTAALLNQVDRVTKERDELRKDKEDLKQSAGY